MRGVFRKMMMGGGWVDKLLRRWKGRDTVGQWTTVHAGEGSI